MDDTSFGGGSSYRRRVPDPLDHDDLVAFIEDAEDTKLMNDLLKAVPHAFLYAGLVANTTSRDPLTLLVSTLPCVLGLLPPHVEVCTTGIDPASSSQCEWWAPIQAGRHTVSGGSLQVRHHCQCVDGHWE